MTELLKILGGIGGGAYLLMLSLMFYTDLMPRVTRPDIRSGLKKAAIAIGIAAMIAMGYGVYHLAMVIT